MCWGSGRGVQGCQPAAQQRKLEEAVPTPLYSYPAPPMVQTPQDASADKVQKEQWGQVASGKEVRWSLCLGATNHCSGHLDCHPFVLRLHCCLEYPVLSRVEVQVQNTS